MVLLALVRTYLMNRTSSAVASFTSTVYKRDPKTFRHLLKEGIILTVIGSFVSSLYNFSKESLSLLWRRKLTNIIHGAYFSYANYYHAANLPGRAAIRDADIMLSRELSSVSTRLANLVSLLVTSLPPIFWFTFKLWKWRGLKFALIPHVYLMLAYEVAQRLFPKNIGDLYRKQAICKAKYSKAK